MGAPWRAVAAGADLAYDVVVVGAGVAGLVAALDVLDASPGCSVAVVDKGEIGSSGSTPLAQGGMAAAVGPGDSPFSTRRTPSAPPTASAIHGPSPS